MDERNGKAFEVSEPGRVLVAGCGAVGSVFACLLARSGCHVEAIGRGPHFEAVRRHGIDIEGIWGCHHARIAAAHEDPRTLSGRFDAILVTCKASQTEPMLAGLPPDCLTGSGRAISLQNGLGNVEKLAAHFGAERALAGRVIFGIEISRPGCAHITVEAEPTLIGHPDRPDDPGAAYWAARFAAAGIAACPSSQILAALWGKVFYNAALNPMGALLGLRYGDLPKDPDRRVVMDRVIDEAFAVAVAEGIAVAWPDAEAYRRHFYDRLLPATLAHRSSMLQDLEKGRPTEIDAICGEICRRGDAHAIDVSANRVLLALVRSRQHAPLRNSAPAQ